MGKIPWDTVGGLAANAAGLNLATSPILLAAQVTIGAMKLTTGSGTPVTGAGIAESLGHQKEAEQTLIDAKPESDQWDGTASGAYNDQVNAHLTRIRDVTEADTVLASRVKAQAEQVASTKKELQGLWDRLGNFDTITSPMGFIPPLRAAKAAAEIVVAAEALAEANAKMTSLSWETVFRARAVSTELHNYQNAVDATLSETGCDGPFGDEHIGGAKLPTRTNPEAPYTPPLTNVPVTPAPMPGMPAPSGPAQTFPAGR